MPTQVLLDHVNEARQARDPEFVDLLLDVINAEPDPNLPPPREGTYTFDTFLSETRSRAFFRQHKDAQAAQRVEKIAALESPDAETPLPERYLSYQLINELYESTEDFDRRCLLDFLKRVPLTYGPWKAIKSIFKLAEANDDTEVYGLLAARFDQAFASGNHQVSHRTLGYLVRRAWRYLRNIGESLPACYAETAVDFLVGYQNRAQLASSWIFNHIFQHDSQAYKRTQFFFSYSNLYGQNYLRQRAFAELWKRSPLPLFDLLQQAKNQKIKNYAVSALKNDFRSVIREIEPRWVKQLASQNDATVHQFVVWVLENVPKFEQASFRELDLHETVLRLLESPDVSARTYAAAYARIHARDLPISELVRLANSADKNVFALAKDLLSRHDPRKDVGLDAWGELLETKNGHELAVTALRKHFGKSELTPNWFRDRMLSGNKLSSRFASDRLLEFHNVNKLGAKYFYDIIDNAIPARDSSTTEFCTLQLGKLDLEAIDTSWLENLLLNFSTSWDVIMWVSKGLVAPSRFSPEFLKAVAYKPTFDECPQVVDTKEKCWADSVSFQEHRSTAIFKWLSDIRQFTPDQIGFDWLMQLVQRSEPEYHDFATNLMTKSFLPADFAPTNAPSNEPATESTSEEINIDFEQAKFLFTGKLATMTRAEAKAKVTAANGKNSGSVGKTLDYLVIGDEGSPLYGEGRKGSKQTTAESLNESGGEIRIISETAFLQMLTGTAREFSDDAVQAGCEQLWSMLTDNKEHTPLAKFAHRYLRHHHPEICLKETDRPVDPGAEIPDEFLTFDKVETLLTDKRVSLRELGLEYCKYEFARWSPPLSQLVELCQTPYPEVRKFVSEALLAEDTPQSRRWRLSPDDFDAESVYQFCQSRDGETRAIGMKLIERYPRLREPEKLFMLTESPDRNVRAFVIRSFWSLYRERGVKDDWKPVEPTPTTKAKAKKEAADSTPRFGVGAPAKPEEPPAGTEPMRFLLRRMLFEIPPGRPPRAAAGEIGELKIKPLPTRRAKILLIETLRDLAIEDGEFAQAIYPVLAEFLQSRGKSEHDACLVATIRIEKAHPSLAEQDQGGVE